MSKPSKGSALYRLIEAGQLARMAVTRPLRDAGLEPGDDAILFLLRGGDGLTEAGLAEALERDGATLAPHIERLIQRGLLVRRAVGPQLELGLVLTDAGGAIRDRLTAHWADVEAELFGDLPKRRRKDLKRMLKAVAGKFHAASTERGPDHPPVDEHSGGDDDEGEDHEPR